MTLRPRLLSLPRPTQVSSRAQPPRQLHTTPIRRRTPLVPTHSPTPPKTHSPAGDKDKEKPSSAKQAYKLWYGQLFPAMMPIILISTGIYLVLSGTRTHLSGNRELEEKSERIAILEAQVARMRADAKRRQERERRERERILPLVVERVLQHVGAMEPEVEEDVQPVQELLV